MTFTTHEAEMRDLPQIALISLRLRDQIGTSYTVSELKEMISHQKTWKVYVARNTAGEVVAFGVLKDRGVDDRRFVIHTTASHPEKRISGAARALNQLRYQEVIRRGGEAVFGSIRAENTSSLRFRLDDGWVITSQNSDWIHVMKDLSTLD